MWQSPKITSWYWPRASLSGLFLAISFSTGSGKPRYFESMAGSHPGEISCRVRACSPESFCCLCRGSEFRRIDPVAGIVSCRLVYVSRLVFHRIFRGGFFCREAGRVGLTSNLAQSFLPLTICLMRLVFFWRSCIRPATLDGPIPCGKSLRPSQDNFSSPLICAGIAMKNTATGRRIFPWPIANIGQPIISRRYTRDTASGPGLSCCGECLTRFARTAGLACLAPLFAMIALAIKLDDGGPVFYSQYRVGKGLRKFRLLKFRSMFTPTARRAVC